MGANDSIPARPLPCIVCDKPLEAVHSMEDGWLQPARAATFRSHGHYGSDFDPMSMLGTITATLNVCDDCMKAKRVSIRILTERPRHGTHYTVTEYNPDVPQ